MIPNLNLGVPKVKMGTLDDNLYSMLKKPMREVVPLDKVLVFLLCG